MPNEKYKESIVCVIHCDGTSSVLLSPWLNGFVMFENTMQGSYGWLPVCNFFTCVWAFALSGGGINYKIALFYKIILYAMYYML